MRSRRLSWLTGESGRQPTLSPARKQRISEIQSSARRVSAGERVPSEVLGVENELEIPQSGEEIFKGEDNSSEFLHHALSSPISDGRERRTNRLPESRGLK